jgi:replicative DNA helicase
MGSGSMTDTLKSKLPPQNIEAEQSVLGVCILGGDAVFEVIDLINEEDFYRIAHSRVFKSIKSLVEKNEPVDIITLKEELNRKGYLEDVGGDVYLTTLLNSAATPTNAAYYAKIVKQKATERKLLETCSLIINDLYDSSMDTDELINSAESRIYEVTNHNLKNDYSVLDSKLMKTYFQELEKYQTEGKQPGLITGFPDLDNLTGGFKPGQLIIIAARPAMGKTSFALNIALKTALKHKNTVAVFSLEMSKKELVTRLISSSARVDMSKLSMKNKKLESNDWLKITQKADELVKAKIFLDDTAGLEPSEIRAKARRIKSKYKDLDLIIVDYLQLMKVRRGKAQNREQEIAEISRTLKEIAKELELPVVALSQLNREVDKRDNKRPRMSDIRESGAIEQDADMIMFLFREEVYNQEDLSKAGLAELIVAKNRSGPMKNIDLIWNAPTTSFENKFHGDDSYIDMDSSTDV